MCCGRGCWRWCGDGIRRHGREEYATKDVSELVLGWDEDEREMDLVGVEGEDGQRRRFQLRVWTGQGRDQRTQLELVVNMSGHASYPCIRVDDAPPVLTFMKLNRYRARTVVLAVMLVFWEIGPVLEPGRKPVRLTPRLQQG